MRLPGDDGICTSIVLLSLKLKVLKNLELKPYARNHGLKCFSKKINLSPVSFTVYLQWTSTINEKRHEGHCFSIVSSGTCTKNVDTAVLEGNDISASEQASNS